MGCGGGAVSVGACEGGDGEREVMDGIFDGLHPTKENDRAIGTARGKGRKVCVWTGGPAITDVFRGPRGNAGSQGGAKVSPRVRARRWATDNGRRGGILREGQSQE
jgi:hypothetical protein